MMRKLKYLLPVVALAIVLGIACGTTAQAEKNTDNGTIADRVYIGEVAVGGMTEMEARAALEGYVAGLADDVVTLKAGEYKVETTVAALGMTWAEEDQRIAEVVTLGKSGNLIDRYKVKKDLEDHDMVFPLVLTVDETLANQIIQDNKDALNNEAVDYGLTREEGAFKVTGGIAGTVIKEAECVDAINTFFAAGWTGETVVELPCDTQEPAGDPEALAKVQDEMGKFSTNYSSSAWGRKANVKNATGFINGTVLYPGETFSVGETINPMTAANGYELAGSYENGETVQTYGGGVCQVSTTLFNAVIRAELEIVERSPHSMTVSYVDPSADAAIAGTYKDLKFKNNTEAPIYIEGYANGSTLTFIVYGDDTREPGRELSFISETIATKDPGEKFTATAAPVGTVTKKQSAHVGKTSQLWKVVKVNGVEQSREKMHKDTYMASPAIYEVGTSSAVPEATAAMKAAIASNDLATIKAAAAQWANATVTPPTPADPNAGTTTPPVTTEPGTGTEPAPVQ